MSFRRMVLVASVIPMPAMATTWYVSNQGSDSNAGQSATTAFATLQRAEYATVAGDTVLALTGTYTVACTGCVVLQITRSGTATAPITYAAASGAHPVINFTNAGEGIEVDAAYITVRGFELAGDSQSITQSYAISNNKNLNNYKTNANAISIDPFVNYMVPHHVIIQGNIVHDAPGSGISACYADYISIYGNTVYGNAFWSPYGGSGISIWESRDVDGYTGYKNFVGNNISYGNQEYVPAYYTGQINDGNGIIIDDNRNTQSGYIPYGGRTLVWNNIVYQNGGSGVHAYSSQHVDIEDNTAYLNNQTSTINEGQIFAYDAADVNIMNNIGVAPAGKVYTNKTGDSATVSSDYNLWYATNGMVGPGGPALGPHDLTGDPLFVSAATGDFHLQAGSPAIGSASANYSATTDYDGNARPSGGGFDRGAYEYQPAQ